MQTAGLVLPCGAQAPLLSGQRKLSCPKVSHGTRSVVFSARVPAKTLRSRSHRTAAVPVTASTASSNGNLLPWQAAMDEVQKRKDLKSIMIIGAGPIVIGQVCLGPGIGTQPQLPAQPCRHFGLRKRILYALLTYVAALVVWVGTRKGLIRDVTVVVYLLCTCRHASSTTLAHRPARHSGRQQHTHRQRQQQQHCVTLQL